MISTIGGDLDALPSMSLASGGRWGYSLADVGSVYAHGTVARDLAAAKAQGLCSG